MLLPFHKSLYLFQRNCLFENISIYSFERHATFLSRGLYIRTPLYARNYATLWKERHVLSKVLLHNAYIRMVFLWKQAPKAVWNLFANSISNFGCVAFLAMILSNFLGGRSNYERTNKKHLGDVDEREFKSHNMSPKMQTWSQEEKGFGMLNEAKNKKTNQWSSMNGWNIGLVFYLLFLWFFPLVFDTFGQRHDRKTSQWWFMSGWDIGLLFFGLVTTGHS